MMKETGPLSAELIRALLPETLRGDIHVFETIDSTNTYARSLALSGAAGGTLVLAEAQSAGRGRRGKSFFSPAGSGLYMSVILRPDAKAGDTQLLTIAAAAAVCRAIEKAAGFEPKIKWVNDLYLNGKKLCGILCERVAKESSADAFVVGIGINCTTAAFPPELSETAGALGAPLSRNELAAKIVSELSGVLSMDSAALLYEYRSRSLMKGRRVRFAQNGETREGVCFGIADSGNLLVQLDSGEACSLSSGEVSVMGLTAWQ